VIERYLPEVLFRKAEKNRLNASPETNAHFQSHNRNMTEKLNNAMAASLLVNLCDPIEKARYFAQIIDAVTEYKRDALENQLSIRFCKVPLLQSPLQRDYMWTTLLAVEYRLWKANSAYSHRWECNWCQALKHRCESEHVKAQLVREHVHDKVQFALFMDIDFPCGPTRITAYVQRRFGDDRELREFFADDHIAEAVLLAENACKNHEPAKMTTEDLTWIASHLSEFKETLLALKANEFLEACVGLFTP